MHEPAPRRRRALGYSAAGPVTMPTGGARLDVRSRALQRGTRARRYGAQAAASSARRIDPARFRFAMSERPPLPDPAVPPHVAAAAHGRPFPPSLQRGRGPRPRRRQTLLRTALRALLDRPVESAHDAEQAVARVMAHVRRLG